MLLALQQYDVALLVDERDERGAFVDGHVCEHGAGVQVDDLDGLEVSVVVDGGKEGRGGERDKRTGGRGRVNKRLRW